MNDNRAWDEAVVQAKTNDQLFADLLVSNYQYLQTLIHKVTNRYISKSDDEWSIALIGFHQAVKSYDLGKGNFHSWSKMIVTQRLIDYLRTQHHHDISVDPSTLDGEYQEEEALSNVIINRIAQQEVHHVQDEIILLDIVLKQYGFNFNDLVKSSPKTTKTRKHCALVINLLLRNPNQLIQLAKSKTLPMKWLEENSQLPRKFLESYRRYIVAVIEIVSGDYPYLWEYVKELTKGE
jgi:RNA polymerase sigma factor